MKLILDDLINKELKEYLLEQDGINNVIVSNKEFLTTLNIDYDKRITPEIIMKHIELFQKNKYSILFEFDKGTIGDFRILKYTIDDICCEYCYKGLIKDLFENEKIKSVKSNFDYNKPNFDIEFIIEYDENYKEEDLIKYIKEKFN